MPYGKGTYGSKKGRPSKKAKAAGKKKMMKKILLVNQVKSNLIKKPKLLF